MPNSINAVTFRKYSLSNPLQFFEDGKMLASGGYDKIVRIWDVARGEEIKRLEGNMAAVRAVAFSRDGKLVASAGSDRRVRIWNLADGRLMKTILAHDAAIRDLAFSPDPEIPSNDCEEARPCGAYGCWCVCDRASGMMFYLEHPRGQTKATRAVGERTDSPRCDAGVVLGATPPLRFFAA